MMLTRKSLLLSAVVVASVTLFAATQVSANPMGVPVAEPGPFSCGGSGSLTMPDFTVAAVPDTTTGEWPIAVACISGNPSKNCIDYVYTITPIGRLNVNHTTFAVSADQDLDGTNPTMSVSINPPGAGDKTGDFLVKAFHEYTVRFNSLPAKGGTVHISIVGPSVPRITTVLVGGTASTDEACLIAGPGVALNPFKPITTEQTVACAGGKCTCVLTFDAAGNITDVTSPDCGAKDAALTINGLPVQFFGNEGITTGTGTCTYYNTKPIPTCVCSSPTEKCK